GHVAAGVFVAVKPDAARKERDQIRAARQAGHVEHSGTLQKECAFLRKEQGKASEIDLTDIGLGLRKVGVYRDRGVQVGGQILDDVKTSGELAEARVFTAGHIRADI